MNKGFIYFKKDKEEPQLFFTKAANAKIAAKKLGGNPDGLFYLKAKYSDLNYFNDADLIKAQYKNEIENLAFFWKE